MPRLVTLIVLVAYIALLLAFVVITCVAGVDSKASWFDLMKTGFTTLGSALTLILGYYFGQKQVAQEIEREKEQEGEEEKRIRLINLLKANTTENQPDDLSKAKLPIGRPAQRTRP